MMAETIESHNYLWTPIRILRLTTRYQAETIPDTGPGDVARDVAISHNSPLNVHVDGKRPCGWETS